MFNDKSDHVTLQSEAVVTKVCDVRDSCSVTTNSAYAQYEEVGRMRAEVMQKLHVISDRLEAVPSMANEQLSTLQGLVEMMVKSSLEYALDVETHQKIRKATYIIPILLLAGATVQKVLMIRELRHLLQGSAVPPAP